MRQGGRGRSRGTRRGRQPGKAHQASATRVVAAVILQGRRVLAARRGPGQRQAGLWEFPGGKVEIGEQDPEALIREILEELDVRVRPRWRLGVSHHRYGRRGIALAAWLCERVAGTPTLHEHDALQWLSFATLRRVRWAPADVPLLARVAALLRHPPLRARLRRASR